jgi:hypothetical protein
MMGNQNPESPVLMVADLYLIRRATMSLVDPLSFRLERVSLAVGGQSAYER